ncbi:MAG TPA: restriction endonuclease subunit S [Candidatus Phocaeicola gallistercoris]|nr:restriction endonuclease subunit S [Candidatus Phocaeicola gallistercoris]
MNTKYIHIGKSTILWEKTSFSRAFKFLKNNSLSRAELSDDNGNVKNIHYGDILIKFSECLYADEGNSIPYIINDNIAYKLLKLSPLINGDIVFADAAEDNTVGKCIEIITHNDTDLVAGLHTIPCRPTIKFAEGYLGYYLNSTAFHNQLLQYIQGTKISSISKKSICQTIISYPSEIINQQKIASYFQSLDSLIQSTSKKLASLKQIKVASLQSMFPQEGETVPKVRFNGFEEEWICVLFKEITYKTGIKNSENLSLESYSISNELGFIPQNKQFENGGTMSKADKRMYYIVSPKSFAYNPARINVGSLGYYQGERDVIVSSLYEVFKTSDIVDDLFLFYWFKTNIFKRMIEQYQEGGVRLYFFFDKLQKCQIKVPSLQEQQKIASYFYNLDKQISLQTQRLEKLKQIKAACLDKMFV